MSCSTKSSLWPAVTSGASTIVSMLLLLLLATQSQAFYSHEPSMNQALYEYYLQAPQVDPLAAMARAPAVAIPAIQLDDATAYKLEPAEAANTAALPLDLLDVPKLVAYLKQLQEDEEEDRNSAISDMNSHLSATDPTASLISAPINDPADFEAALSELTSAINHEVPNSSNRSQVLDSLLSVYLGSIMQQLKQQQQRGDSDADDDNGNLQFASADATTAASRYGGGEYIDHPLALIGHQYVQGGAGEGRQLLGPDGSFENVQVVKSDHAVPSYCDPPNPCPIGYTAEDGCLEKFVNSASFSREYQVKQQCSCDNEHSLFNCASPVSTMKSQVYSTAGGQEQQQGGDGGPSTGGHPMMKSANENAKQLAANRLDTLARTIQNRFGGLASVRNLIDKQQRDNDDDDYSQHDVVKKGSHIGSDFKY